MKAVLTWVMKVHRKPLMLVVSVILTLIRSNTDFADPGVFDTHTATWNWGDGTKSVLGKVSSPVISDHTYNITGIYTIIFTVQDDDGGEGLNSFQYIVVYNPEGGFVTGSANIISPKGAFLENPSLTGRANFGFQCKYTQGDIKPNGQIQFMFPTAHLRFSSTSYDSLVVVGDKAQFEGSGSFQGDGDY